MKVQCVFCLWIRFDKLIKLMESFLFQISNSFLNIWPDTEIFQTIREAWILIKVHCVIYQWIRLDKVYELMKSFFQILESYLNNYTF